MAVTSYPVETGSVDSTDVNGNPTPNTTTFPPANYEEGTIFHAENFTGLSLGTDTFEGGDMTFQIQSGAWVWISGSYRASNSNGEYQRFADGRQECGHTPTLAFNDTSDLRVTWTFPKAFSAAPRVRHTIDLTGASLPGTTDNLGNTWTVSPTTTNVVLGQERIAGGTNFVSGNTVATNAVAVGRWK